MYSSIDCQTIQYQGEKYQIVWQPNPGPQKGFIDCKVFEILYGGARGGGKTDGCLAKLAFKAHIYNSASRAIWFRKTLPQLEDAIRRSKEIYYKLGGIYNETKKTWTMPGGGTIKFRYVMRESDIQHYIGQQYTDLVFEECTQWKEQSIVDLMRGSVRSPEGVPCQILLTGNPGGPGHNWVKSRYISPHPTGYTIIKDRNGSERVFIPSRLEHNPMLLDKDPEYKNRLKAIGNPALVKAWLEGSWDIIDGCYWDSVFSPETHIIEPFKIPLNWPIIVSFDWGYSSPSSVGIWAKSTGSSVDYKGKILSYPKGTFIRVGEIYTVEKNYDGSVKPNKGSKLKNEQQGALIGRTIKKIKDYQNRIKSLVADPSIFSEGGNESIVNKIHLGMQSEGVNLTFERAYNPDILSGLHEMLDRFQASLDKNKERPGLYVFSNCTNWIRTVPVLQRDSKNFDLIANNQEDHCCDETRYAIRERSNVYNKFEYKI